MPRGPYESCRTRWEDPMGRQENGQCSHTQENTRGYKASISKGKEARKELQTQEHVENVWIVVVSS